MSETAPPKTAPDAEAPPKADADAAAPDAKAPDAETAAAAPDGAPAPGKKKVIRRVVKNTYSTDPALYIYTTLTAGSSHTVTATSRLETILRANRVPFKALDLATDEKAKMLWGRRAGKDAKNRPRKLPALVQMGMVLGDLVEIEEWNEYGEVRQHVKIYYDEFTIPAKGKEPPPNPLKQKADPGVAPSKVQVDASAKTPASSAPAAPIPAPPPMPEKGSAAPSTAAVGGAPKPPAGQKQMPIRSVAEEAAQKAKQQNLERLRAKVHGSKKDAAKDDGAAPAPAATKDMTIETTGADAKTPSAAAGGLQSPTSGAWRAAAEAEGILQSPTTGTWKAGEGMPSIAAQSASGAATASDK